MDRDTIIRMAREAGFTDADEKGVWITDGYWDDEIKRFAGLVVAHTLANIDSFNKASYQEGYNAGIEAANNRHCEVLKHFRDTVLLQERVNSLRTRSKA